MTVTDERLNQLANDPMMCNITPEVQECLRELVALRAENERLSAPVSPSERTAILLALQMYRQQENSNATSRIDDIERIIADRRR